MKYYLQDTVGKLNEVDYCFTDELPKGVFSYGLKAGEVVDDYPSDPWAVTWELGEDYPGLLLPSFIGNTDCLLVFHKEVIEFLKDFNVGKAQSFPFTLINYKKRVHSKDYLFFNPLGTFDCLHEELSEINIDEDDGEIFLGIDKMCLVKKSLEMRRIYFESRKTIVHMSTVND